MKKIQSRARWSLLRTLFGVAAFFPAFGHAQTLLINGSFEVDSAPINGGLYGIGAGWDSSYISYVGPAAFPDGYLSFTRIPAHDGNRVEWMPPGTSIFQDVSLTAGSAYALSLFTTPTSAATADTALTATITNGSQTFASTFNVIHGTSVWTNSQLHFTPSNSGIYTVLLFAANNGTSTIYLDSVSLTAIPEPSTVALLLGACALVFAIRRGRSNKEKKPANE